MSAPLINLGIERPADVSSRNHRTFMRLALKSAALVHKLTKSIKHFQRNKETAPGGDYGYVPRTKAHMLRKSREVGHQDPNVFTGRERAHVIANSRITGTWSKSRVVYRPLHSRDSEQSARWVREIGAISDGEAEEATERAQEMYDRQVEIHRQNRQRVRIS